MFGTPFFLVPTTTLTPTSTSTSTLTLTTPTTPTTTPTTTSTTTPTSTSTPTTTSTSTPTTTPTTTYGSAVSWCTLKLHLRRTPRLNSLLHPPPHPRQPLSSVPIPFVQFPSGIHQLGIFQLQMIGIHPL